MNDDYIDFLKRKSVVDPDTGLASVPPLNKMLYPHQADLVKWALRRGRAALFADCGIGKSPMQMEWADKQPHESGYQAIKMGRKFVGSELKQSYFTQACKNIQSAKSNQADMFSYAG